MKTSIFSKLTPHFLNYHSSSTSLKKQLFNLRRMWEISILLTSTVTILPLILLTIINYNITQKSTESEILLMTSRVVSNAKSSVSFFLTERKTALDFIIHDYKFNDLNDHKQLVRILKHLKMGFGGFIDLGIIGANGIQTTYAGEYNLQGKNYSNQEWFKKVLKHGNYISDVFPGFRNRPHLIIAVKHALPDSSFYVLRATLDMDIYNKLLSRLKLHGKSDAFIINHAGILQTPSHQHGSVLQKASIPVPKYSNKTEAIEFVNKENKSFVMGYAYIPDTNFILIIVKQKNELIKPWQNTQSTLIWVLVISITVILLVILGLTTYFTNSLYTADQKRVMAMHRIEFDSKMASIGRLAAGVAHEINNPLAIINEKAGLIKDTFIFKHQYTDDPKLITLVDSVISSVTRCGAITKRLLNFSRDLDASLQLIEIKNVIRDVLGFLNKEAEYRNITVSINIPDNTPQIKSDRGKLQQIFLNIINNAFAALDDGGSLDINVIPKKKQGITVIITDNGCGIAEEDLKLIFEPFFTKKAKRGGTGLGLSITYGLAKEIGGFIEVQSKIGEGTSFTITLPYNT
ncbi:MAG: two-component sensor histidine kinase [Desulfobacteraceae bacterium 4572_19]|nr:MAG: two-component sensor histidine kinase [Desulfobacteraceae bacterium 4572_19]